MSSPGPSPFDYGTSTGTAMDPTTQQPTPPPPVREPGEGGDGINPYLPGQPVVEPGPLQWISNYYQGYLGREADQPGLDFWKNSVESGQNSLDDVRNAIQNSDEGQRYGINQLYKNALGREADQPGFDSWLNALKGGTSLNDISNSFYNSDEYKNAHQRPTVPEVQPPIGPFGPTDDPMGPKPEVEPGQPIVDPVWFDENGDPHMGYDPDPKRKQYVDRYPDGISTPTTRPYETDDFSNPGQGTSNIKDLFGGGGLFGGMNQGIIPQEPVDPVMDFVKNLDQQPMYLQNAFQQQLQRFGDPVQAARAVIGSFS